MLINKAVSRGRLVQWKNVRFVKISSKGDRGSIPAEGSFFSGAINSQFMFDRNHISDGFFQSCNLVSKSAVAATYYCMKRNVALKIGPMTKMTSYILLRNTTTILQPTTIISSRMVSLRWTAETLIGLGQANGWPTRLGQEGG